MFKKSFIIALLLIGFTACEREDLPVKFLEINDGGVATFTVENKIEKDVASLTTTFTYFSEENRILKIDTVDYAMQDKSQAFLPAGRETYIGQKVPEGTTSASGEIINYEVMK